MKLSINAKYRVTMESVNQEVAKRNVFLVEPTWIRIFCLLYCLILLVNGLVYFQETMQLFYSSLPK